MLSDEVDTEVKINCAVLVRSSGKSGGDCSMLRWKNMKLLPMVLFDNYHYLLYLCHPRCSVLSETGDGGSINCCRSGVDEVNQQTKKKGMIHRGLFLLVLSV